jgi:hypothetical protein
MSDQLISLRLRPNRLINPSIGPLLMPPSQQMMPNQLISLLIDPLLAPPSQQMMPNQLISLQPVRTLAGLLPGDAANP